MKEYLQKQLTEAVTGIVQSQRAKLPPNFTVSLERSKQADRGDFSSSVALVLAAEKKEKPRPLAEAIQKGFTDPDGFVAAVEIAGPGFLNFRLNEAAWQRALPRIESPHFARPNLGKGQKVLVEYVSANPTGPLHVGNARGGPIGDCIARILSQCGYEVTTEFYVNDIGGQVRRLGHSILHWMREAAGKASEPPEEGYYGDYVKELASKATTDSGPDYLELPEGEAIELLASWGVRQLLEEIRADCEAMGSSFDRWVLEHELRDQVEPLLEKLQTQGAAQKKEGALWFINPNDPEDRESVLVRQTGEPTYFADDLVCHRNRYQEGFDRIINVWGSNHHGHVPRIKAALQALGYNPDALDVVLYQYVRVCRGTDVVKMSKRAGDYVTAREVLEEVGPDAMRFFLLQRAASAHLDFDLELAKKENAENPIYYIQYAHARIASVQRMAEQKGIGEAETNELDLGRLELPEELALIKFLFQYPDEIEIAARELAPHRIAFYLLELARKFHTYYSRAKQDPRYRVLSADIDSSQAKLYLLRVVQSVLADGLQLLNLTAPEQMTSPPEEDL